MYELNMVLNLNNVKADKIVNIKCILILEK